MWCNMSHDSNMQSANHLHFRHCAKDHLAGRSVWIFLWEEIDWLTNSSWIFSYLAVIILSICFKLLLRSEREWLVSRRGDSYWSTAYIFVISPLTVIEPQCFCLLTSLQSPAIWGKYEKMNEKMVKCYSILFVTMKKILY